MPVVIVGLACTLGVVTVEVVALLALPQTVALGGVLDILVTFGVGVSVLTGIFLVAMLRPTYANPRRRRVVCALLTSGLRMPAIRHYISIGNIP